MVWLSLFWPISRKSKMLDVFLSIQQVNPYNQQAGFPKILENQI